MNAGPSPCLNFCTHTKKASEQ